MITHELDMLSTLATRVLVLAEGQVAVDGPLAEVKESGHPFVASFFGAAEPLLHSE
jgi:ABC-type transporter Mla maintaining outer membrane lipid asymmetry ATPase subunit MlaF